MVDVVCWRKADPFVCLVQLAHRTHPSEKCDFAKFFRVEVCTRAEESSVWRMLVVRGKQCVVDVGCERQAACGGCWLWEETKSCVHVESRMFGLNCNGWDQLGA